MGRFAEALEIRYNKMLGFVNEYVTGVFWIFGNGMGRYESLSGTQFLSIDGQFTRIFIETGISGILLWPAFFLLVFRKVLMMLSVSPNVARAGRAFFVAFLVSMYPYDVLLLSASGFLFWLFIFFWLSAYRQTEANLIFGRQASPNERKSHIPCAN